jgi:hypothetical protein
MEDKVHHVSQSKAHLETNISEASSRTWEDTSEGLVHGTANFVPYPT